MKNGRRYLLWVEARAGRWQRPLHGLPRERFSASPGSRSQSPSLNIGKGAAFEDADPDVALTAYEHALGVARKSGNRWAESLAIPRISALHARSGAPIVALHGFERMLEAYGGATDLAFVSAWRASLIVLLAKLGRMVWLRLRSTERSQRPLTPKASSRNTPTR